eukprot:gene8870-11964_t
MAANGQYEKLYSKFQIEGLIPFKNVVHNHDQSTANISRAKMRLRECFDGLSAVAVVQLDIAAQLQFYRTIAFDIYSTGEYLVAIDYFKIILSTVSTNETSLGDKILIIRQRIDAEQMIVKCNYLDLKNNSHYSFSAPMTVSKYLVYLKTLRGMLDSLFELKTKQQEELSYLILNCCKLILEIGQPLLYFNCGKYVTETILFAGTCMEAVINLCTIRHMKFRMKIYASVFYASLTQGSIDEATSVMDHISRQVRELREREEVDPPIPPKNLECLKECDSDVSIMKAVLLFWRDPESLLSAQIDIMMMDPIMKECIRVHLLTSGNATNENYRKRSIGIIKSIDKKLLSFNPVSIISDDSPEKTVPIDESILNQFTIQGLFEIVIIAVFESIDGVDLDSLLIKIFALGKEISKKNATNGVNIAQDEMYEKDLEGLKSLLDLVGMGSNAIEDRLQILSIVLNYLDYLINRESSYRTHSLIRKVSMTLWSRFIYPDLQSVLSSLDQGESSLTIAKIANEISPALVTVVRAFDYSNIDDPILLGCLSLTSANLLWLLNERTDCINYLKRAMKLIEEHRAARVDFSLHLPEDVRDIHAIQRESFTTRADAVDWYHSVKRLGAHAFAGYGIFGLSSSSDRTEQALSEISTDLISFYFKCELLNSIEHRKIILINKKQKEDEEIEKQKTSLVQTMPKKKPPKVNKFDRTGEKTFESELKEVQADKLSIIKTLRQFCSRNSYYRALLFVEMARVDTREESRIEYLNDAQKSIEECEAKEAVLLNSFADLTTITSKARKYPIVLGRSHQYIYVCPVHTMSINAPKKQQFSNSLTSNNHKNEIIYYRILAKEKGSGTDVSIASDTLSGCEKRIPYTSLNHPQSSFVRIGPLVPGEVYVFGSLAFNSNNEPVGSISPTSPPVDAVNPIPTILLWSILNEAAEELLTLKQVAKFAANKVCNRFFLKNPEMKELSVTKGLNLFLTQQPSFCALAIQQSSPVLIHSFINSFLSYEAIHRTANFNENDDNLTGKAQWLLRKHQQLPILKSLDRISLVLSLLCGSDGMKYDLIVQVLVTTFNLATDLLKFDILHMAARLQYPLSVMIIALQSVPKSNWQLLEHQLYCRIFASLTKVSIINRNISPILRLIDNFYPESVNQNHAEPSQNDIFVPNPSDYTDLIGLIRHNIHSNHLKSFENHIINIFPNLSLNDYKALPNNNNDVGYLWSIPLNQRKEKLLSVTTLSNTAIITQIITWMNEKPNKMSDLLQGIVFAMRSIIDNPSNNNTIGSKLFEFIPKIVIIKQYLAEEVSALHDELTLTVCKDLDDIVKSKAEQANAAVTQESTTKNAKKGAPVAPVEDPSPTINVDELMKIPERYLLIDEQEKNIQLKYFGEILFLLSYYGSFAMVRDGKTIVTPSNQFPVSKAGPNRVIHPVLEEEDIQNSLFSNNNDEIKEENNNNSVVTYPMSKLDYVKYLSASIECTARCNGLASHAAVLVATKLWNSIMNDWNDPVEFTRDYVEIAPTLHRLLLSLVTLFENEGRNYDDNNNNLLIQDNADNDDESVDSNNNRIVGFKDEKNIAKEIIASYRKAFTAREFNEHITSLRELLIFLLKFEWIRQSYEQVVSIGSRIFVLFLNNCTSDYAKQYGEHCVPLMQHAQHRLVDLTVEKLEGKKKEMEDFIFNYTEAAKKKRKKKARIARVEKDEDELLFDAEKSVFEGEIDDMKKLLESHNNKLKKVLLIVKRFDTMFSSGTQLLNKVSKNMKNFLSDISMRAVNISYRELLVVDNSIEDKVDSIIDQYASLCSYLREKKERLVLVEALHQLGDLMILFEKFVEVKSVFYDIIDGLFNTIDAIPNWSTIRDGVISPNDNSFFDKNKLVSGIIPAIIVLGKLSKFCSPGDWDLKSAYAGIATDLSLLLFTSESVGHPVTLPGFATYFCSSLHGCYALNSYIIEPKGFISSIYEIIQTILSSHLAGCGGLSSGLSGSGGMAGESSLIISSLPLVVLLEHFTAFYLLNPTLWLEARLLRLQILSNIHFFGEFVSMLSSIEQTLESIISQNLDDFLRLSRKVETADPSIFDTSSHGLDLYGNPPFINNKLIDENQKSLTWVAQYPEYFINFTKKYSVALPQPILSIEEKKRLEEERIKQMEIAAALAAEAAKKNKGKKGAVEEKPVELPDDSAKKLKPLFESFDNEPTFYYVNM